MKNKVVFLVVAMAAVIAALIVIGQHSKRVTSRVEQDGPLSNQAQTEPETPATARPPGAVETKERPAARSRLDPTQAGDVPVLSTNKLERLAQLREQFQALAAGPPEAAMQAAKLIQNETERETALQTLVTQWTQGELRPARDRAIAIARYGLEAGLGMELASKPDLAVAWANALTEGAGQQALLSQAAIGMAGQDPATAFALGEELPEEQRQRFFETVFAGWASKDTQSALDFANQLPEASQRDDALKAIRTEAPVGIGTEMTMKDGYPVVQRLLPGTPAELSGQLHPGDRIVALSQGDNSFVPAQGVPLSDVVQMIRGQPGTTLQLQILSGDAPPGSLPQTITITRDQLKFKR